MDHVLEIIKLTIIALVLSFLLITGMALTVAGCNKISKAATPTGKKVVAKIEKEKKKNKVLAFFLHQPDTKFVAVPWAPYPGYPGSYPLYFYFY